MRAQSPSPRPARSPFALLVAAGLLWGTGGVTGRALADSSGLSSVAVAAYRLAFGGAIITAIVMARRTPFPRSRSAWLRICVTGALAAGFQSAYFSAVSVGTVSIATFVTIGSAPIFVVVAEAAHRRQLPGWRLSRAVLLGIGGLALLIGSGVSGGPHRAGTACFVFAGLSGCCFAMFTLSGRRRLPDGVDAQTVTGYGFLLGGSALAVLTAPFATLGFAPSGRTLSLLVVFAVFPTAVAYTFFFGGLRRSTAAAAALVALLEPLTGTVLAMMLFGDRMSAEQIVGALVLLASVVGGGRARSPGVVG
jgi:drug/metabolite transporter, DME family